VTKRSPPSLRALRPDVPPPLEAAIAKCLQKDRTKRYATVGELSLALAPFGTERVQLSVDRIAQVGRSAKGPRPSMFPVPESTGSQQRGVPISWWKTAKWVVARRGLTWSKGTIAAGLLTLAGIGLIGADLLSRRSARLPVSAAPATSRAVATAAPTSSASSGLIPLPIVAPSLPAAEPAVAAAPPADCRVDLNSTPASTVSIDGRKLGTTPKVNVAASPGQHVVVFQHGPRDRVTTSIDCKSGEAKTVSVRIGRETDDSAKATGGKTAPSH
jgi:serine/threonine-protein kinase